MGYELMRLPSQEAVDLSYGDILCLQRTESGQMALAYKVVDPVVDASYVGQELCEVAYSPSIVNNVYSSAAFPSGPPYSTLLVHATPCNL